MSASMHDKRAEMIERARGLRTVPQIFIHGRHVGGYEELAMLEREGKLDGWLANAPEAPRARGSSRKSARHDRLAPTSASAPRLVQLRSSRSVDANLEAAETLIRRAAQGGAVYVQTPENTALMELEPKLALATAQPEDASVPLTRGFARWPRELGIFLHIGSLAIKLDDDSASPTALISSIPRARSPRSYDKLHLFDVDLAGGESYRESQHCRPGGKAVLVDLPFGRLGLSICYDLRFPQLYRALATAGAEFIAIPAAFTKQTGEAHWHVLIRARAIETGAFVLAATQGGLHENGRATFGHSLIVSPWGEVLAEAGEEPGVIFADIDLAASAEARARIPALKHGREFEIEIAGADAAAPRGGRRHDPLRAHLRSWSRVRRLVRLGRQL